MIDFNKMLEDIAYLQTEIGKLKTEKKDPVKELTKAQLDEKKSDLQNKIKTLFAGQKEILEKYSKILTETDMSKVHLKTIFSNHSLTSVLEFAEKQILAQQEAKAVEEKAAEAKAAEAKAAKAKAAEAKAAEAKAAEAKEAEAKAAEAKAAEAKEAEAKAAEAKAAEAKAAEAKEAEAKEAEAKAAEAKAAEAKEAEAKEAEAKAAEAKAAEAKAAEAKAAAKPAAKPAEDAANADKKEVKTGRELVMATFDELVKTLAAKIEADSKDIAVITLCSRLHTLSKDFLAQPSMTSESFKEKYAQIMTPDIQKTLAKQPALKQLLLDLAYIVASVLTVFAVPIITRIATRNAATPSFRPEFFKPAPEVAANALNNNVAAMVG